MIVGHILRDSSSKPAPPGEICEETNRCLWVNRRCLDQLDVKGWAGSDGHSLQCFSQVWLSPLQMCRWPSRQEFRPHSEWRIEKQKTTEDRGWSVVLVPSGNQTCYVQTWQWNIHAIKGGFNGKIIYKWGIFHCHIWWPEDTPSFWGCSFHRRSQDHRLRSRETSADPQPRTMPLHKNRKGKGWFWGGDANEAFARISGSHGVAQKKAQTV